MATPNMNLTLPVPYGQPSPTDGPAWADMLNAALLAIDGHNHTAGQGVALSYIPPAVLSITSKGDSSLAPGNATLNKGAGLSCFTVGTAQVTITNNLVDIYSVIMVTLINADTARVSYVRALPGAFTVYLDSNAAGNLQFAWAIVN